MGVNSAEHILLITLDYPPQVGGVAQFLERTVEQLRKTSTVHVVTERQQNHQTSNPDAQNVYHRALIKSNFPIWPKWLVGFFTSARLVRQLGTTYILAGQTMPVGTIAYALKLFFGIPYSVFAYGTDVTLPRSSGRKAWLMRRILHNADWIFCASNYTATEVQQWGIAQAKTIVVYPGPSKLQTDVLQAKVDEARKQYGALGKRVLLSVSRLEKRKGHDMVLRALPLVITKIPNLLYLIVGRGPERGPLLRIVNELRISERVEFLDYVSSEDLGPLYEISDAFIIPSRTISNGTIKDFEGFGIVFLDANTFAKPVIGGRSGGIPEAISDGESGLLVNPEDEHDIAKKIVSLLSDERYAHRLGEQGRERVKKFSWDVTSQPMLAALGLAKKPLVSVIIPCYQAESTIRRTLQSIQAQSYSHIDIIAVNDGSTDRTIDILRSFSNLTVIQQSNAGSSAARNAGAATAKGKYLFFCDADVVLHPRAIDTMVKTLETHADASYCYANFRFGWRTFSLFEFDPDRLRRENYISTMSLIRKEHFPGFDPSLKRLQDWDLWLTMLEHGHTGIWYPGYLFSTPLRSGGISQQGSKPPEDAVQRIIIKHRIS